MNNEMFQKVFEELEPLLPQKWEKVIFTAVYTIGSYSMKYYTQNTEGKLLDCFTQQGADKLLLVKQFMKIDQILAADRKSADESRRWNRVTMVVESDGKMKADFDYAAIECDAIENEQMWKEKYLQ